MFWIVWFLFGCFNLFNLYRWVHQDGGIKIDEVSDLGVFLIIFSVSFLSGILGTIWYGSVVVYSKYLKGKTFFAPKEVTK